MLEAFVSLKLSYFTAGYVENIKQQAGNMSNLTHIYFLKNLLKSTDYSCF